MPKIKQLLDVRLPAHAAPERYRIMLHPDFKAFAFRGEETIYLTLAKPTSEILLHAKDLKIRNVIYRSGQKTIPAKKISYSRGAETASFLFPGTLPKGKGELDLQFEGKLTENMQGFYRSRYHVAGEEKYIATTQFESTDARRAFPCFDEPSQKAVFDVTLIVPKNHTAISNTIETDVKEHGGGYKAVRFLPTPKMSTYLLAFIAGEFDFVETKTQEGILVRVFVTRGKKEQAKFALDVAARTLSFYTKYFGIPYPLPVLDMIAIPDFAAGAMENWGAVTYRETALLVDPENTATANKQWVALVIAHELAHQWFGNLVTMEWWTHLWLNEGFASYIEYLAVDHIFPEWDIWTQFVYQDLGAALSLDALRHTHPIEVEVHHPDEIGEIFDAVSYQKGASIIRMLADYLGEANFRKGLNHYLTKHQYANAETNDLWLAFEHVSGRPVQKIMQNWTRGGGYPVITVQEKQKGLELRQSRFYSSALSKKASKDKTLWSIPVSFRRQSSQRVEKTLLNAKSKIISLRLKKDEWVKFNYGLAGVYRVDYPMPLLAALERGVSGGQLAPRDRLSLENDAFALAEAGGLPTYAALALCGAYKNETDYTVWADMAAHLAKLELLLANQKCLGAYKKYALEIFAGIAGRLGWQKRPRETHTDTLLRSLALFNAGSYGDAKIVYEAQKRFQLLGSKKNKIPADLRSVVYGLVAENGAVPEYEKLMTRYRHESLQEEKNRLGRALGRFRSKKLLSRTLRFALSRDVRAQDADDVIGAVFANPRGRDLAWNFVTSHWRLIVKRYGHGGHTLRYFVQPAAVFTTEAKAQEIQRFFKTHEAPGASRSVLQVIERVRSHAAWLRRDGESIAKWLEHRSSRL
ncbi:MAG: M1 family metallopeptidase [Candidatus Sungbacteria bacterium]|uniref:Aminopeptidase n=1 Tax=Candidatus Sungiibacteriota bacterium TaxID=2750080 RepID=A0A931SBF9_9BACT|nr:M1 family metallopeptidase [Candidatus Sungbacteria bacterium]